MSLDGWNIGGSMAEDKTDNKKTGEENLNLGFLSAEILYSVLKLGDNAYGVPICSMIEKNSKKRSVGAIYETLHRLEEKNYLESNDTEPGKYRGGRKKRVYRVTGRGLKALNETRIYQARIMKNLEIDHFVPGSLVLA